MDRINKKGKFEIWSKHGNQKAVRQPEDVMFIKHKEDGWERQKNLSLIFHVCKGNGEASLWRSREFFEQEKRID